MSQSDSTVRERTVVFPLRIAAGGRYLVDSDGAPFFMQGDAAWSLIAQLTDRGVDRYLGDRRRKGFNTVLVNLLERRYSARAPRNAYGEAPFDGPDFSTPNPRYFSHVDTVLRKAKANGILVLLAPAYLGWEGGDDGWWKAMRSAGIEQLREYGRYLGKRYRTFSNILWVNGGDFDPPRRYRNLVSAIAEGIREVDDKLQTFHGGPYNSSLGYWGKHADWVDVNAFYTGYWDVVLQARKAYRVSRAPAFLIEAKYENEGVAGEGTMKASALVVRTEAYQAVLAGAFGSIMGNNPIWLFDPGWEKALDSPGSLSFSRLGVLFRALDWWMLRPDLRRALLTGGIGSDATEAVASVAADRRFAVVYIPSPRTVAIDVSQLRGPMVESRWYDPVSGRSTLAAGSPFRASHEREFTTPGKNAGGDGDYVLLLRSVKR